MEITDVNLYLTKDQIPQEYLSSMDHNYPPQATPMSIFPEYNNGDWRTGSGAYSPFIVELVTNNDVSGICLNVSGGEISCKIIDEWLERFVVGANPFEINRIWEQMYRAQLPVGQGGLTYFAISAIDLALWDLVGKITDQPVYNLLGGKTKSEIPCYVTVYNPEVMEHMVDEGFIGVKLPMRWGPKDGRQGLDNIEQFVSKAREMFNTDIDIMLECYMSWNKEFTVRAANRLSKYDVRWIEDPLLPGQTVDQYVDIRHDIKPIQLAVGNLEWGHKAFQQIINHNAGDIIQPDPHWVGGITEMQRIVAMAKPRGVTVIPHYLTPYTAHFIISQIETPFAEWFVGKEKEITSDKFGWSAFQNPPVPENGRLVIDETPGFGVDIDWDQTEPF